MRFPGSQSDDVRGRPAGGVHNHADGNVGAQARDIINSTFYVVSRDDPPKVKFEKGVKCLAAGVASLALERIEMAIADGHRTTEVCFYWLLATLENRSDQDLTDADVAALAKRLSTFDEGDDEWTRGVQTIWTVLAALDDDRAGAAALDRLQALAAPQRSLIYRHLDGYLSAAARNLLWQRTLAEAAERQCSNGRRRRARWYFIPNPMAPRTRPPRVPSTTAADLWQARAIAAVLTLGIGYLGWLVFVRGWWPGILAYLAMLAAGAIVSWAGAEWRYRLERLRTEDRKYSPCPRRMPVADGGFASRVDQLFDRYFARLAPAGEDAERWLEQTGGYRNTLRDEVVELYRESRVGAARIRWLVRHLVREVRAGWDAGTLWQYRDRYRTPGLTRAAACLGIVTLVPALVTSAAAAVPADPIFGSLDVPLVLVSGGAAASRWLRIVIERRRFRDEQAECTRRETSRRAGYESWKRWLEQNRPSEDEMAAWLDADRTMLLAKALREYKLQHRDIARYAVLETPLGRRRARARGGPWRYARYRSRLFLLTSNGVRMYTNELDFVNARFENARHISFGFESITSADVQMSGDLPRTLDLRLVDGNSITVTVTGENDEQPTKPQKSGDSVPARSLLRRGRASTTTPPPQESEAAESIEADQLTLEASGLPHTLHLLEGIAAEGKHWMQRSRVQRPA